MTPFLDKSGVMTTAHGLKIACLGGIYDSNIYAAAGSAHVREFNLDAYWSLA